MQKITPFFWFNDNAEAAVNYYTSIFKNSKIIGIARYGEASAKATGRPKGSVMTIAFQLEGQDFVALNGGPEFKFTPAISLFVGCKTQKELDRLWNRLAKGGQKLPCGWLTDKFGVSWQLVPAMIMKMLGQPEKTEKVMQAVMKMGKLNIAKLEAAYRG